MLLGRGATRPRDARVAGRDDDLGASGPAPSASACSRPPPPTTTTFTTVLRRARTSAHRSVVRQCMDELVAAGAGADEADRHADLLLEEREVVLGRRRQVRGSR